MQANCQNPKEMKYTSIQDPEVIARAVKRLGGGCYAKGLAFTVWAQMNGNSKAGETHMIQRGPDGAWFWVRRGLYDSIVGVEREKSLIGTGRIKFTVS